MTTNTPLSSDIADIADEAMDEASPACVLVFNASDPSGAGGLTADISTIASVGGHPIAVVTGAYARDTAEIFAHFGFDDEAVTEKARAVLEDLPVQAIKVGFVGSPENISAIAEITTDYDEVPVIAYMPNLSWWQDDLIDQYLDAFRELLLPQTSVLVGNHSTLWRWLLPDWKSDRSPTARDIARAAAEMGVPYTLVTGIPLPEQFVENVLASPQTVLGSVKFELFDATFRARATRSRRPSRPWWPAAMISAKPRARRSVTWTAAWMPDSAQEWATSFPIACSGPSPMMKMTMKTNPLTKHWPSKAL